MLSCSIRNFSTAINPFSLPRPLSLLDTRFFFLPRGPVGPPEGSRDFATARGTPEIVCSSVFSVRGRGRKTHLHRQVSDGESLDGRTLVRGIAIKLPTPFVPFDGIQRVALGVIPTFQRRRVALPHGRRYLDAHSPQTRANS